MNSANMRIPFFNTSTIFPVRKIEWDKVEIDTILTTEIEGLDQYVDINQLGCKPFLYLKGINYSSSDRPLIHANEYINTAIIKFNMIRQKNIRY